MQQEKQEEIGGGIDPTYEKFLKELEEKNDPEHKIVHAVQFMENALQRNNRPQFKHFWEARKLLVEFLKLEISPSFKQENWDKSGQLAQEARHLKGALEKQSAFAFEQIAIAIEALEKDLTQIEELEKKAPAFSLPPNCKAISETKGFYLEAQPQLNLLNAFASRVNSLRKELLKTELWGKQKNGFFLKLSSIGDEIFPKRKEMIKEVSDQFKKDVENYKGAHFSEESLRLPLRVYREEIKALQGIAKLITLNTQCFNDTRKLLSECWQQVKEQEKERKKEFSKKKELYDQNEEEIRKRVTEYQEKAPSFTNEQALEELSDIAKQLRSSEMTHKQVTDSKNLISDERKKIHDKMASAQRLRDEEHKERLRKRKEQLTQIKEKASLLIEGDPSMPLEELVQKSDAITEEFAKLQPNRGEKMDFESITVALKDAIHEKREQTLLELPEDDQVALKQLQSLLVERKERRVSIKQQLERYRKEKGSSGLDIERAMAMLGQEDEEKKRLVKIDSGIQEIEQRIEALKGNTLV